MGMQDRDWYIEAQKERAKASRAKQDSTVSRGNRWALLVMVTFWIAVMGALYLGFRQYEQPKTIITANGDVVIKRALDGHFYVMGKVNGISVRFLVDTGASLVVVSEKFAQKAGITGGQSTTFKTANGELAGRIVSNVPINVGPIDVSGIRVGVGLEGGDVNDALLGQNFLAKFDVLLRQDQMTLRKRQ